MKSERIITACSECAKNFRVSAVKLGKSMECKGCGSSFVIAELEATEASATRVEKPTKSKASASGNATKTNITKDEQPLVTLKHHDFKDDFEITHPDEIMSKAQGNSLLLTLIFSIIAHFIVLTCLSMGYIQDALKYETIFPKDAIAEESKTKRLAAKKAKAEAAEKKRAEAQAAAAKAAEEAVIKPKKIDTTGKNGKKKLSKIEQEIQETSDERPSISDLDSIDDDF